MGTSVHGMPGVFCSCGRRGRQEDHGFDDDEGIGGRWTPNTNHCGTRADRSPYNPFFEALSMEHVKQVGVVRRYDLSMVANATGQHLPRTSRP